MNKYDKKRLNKTKTTKNIVSYLSYIDVLQKDNLHNVNFCGICVNNKELL